MDSATRDQEITAIRELVADTERFQSDLEGFDRLLTQDVDLVNFVGRRVRGRDTVHQVRKQALQTPLAQVLARNELEDVRFLRPDVALASCVKYVSDERESPSGQRAAPLPERGRLTFVLVKEEGRWLIASYQVTPIVAPVEG